MALSIAFACPIDGLTVDTTVTTRLGTVARDVDGNFVRDATQHVHERGLLRGVCPNGHHWSCDVDLVLVRRDPTVVVDEQPRSR